MAARVNLHVALERDHEPIRGTLTGSDGTPHDFTGWLELMSALDAAHDRASDGRSEPAADGHREPSVEPSP
jgi:hypothetical protein